MMFRVVTFHFTESLQQAEPECDPTCKAIATEEYIASESDNDSYPNDNDSDIDYSMSSTVDDSQSDMSVE